MSVLKQLLVCFVVLGVVAPQVNLCRSLSAGCWFDSSCCSGLCQRFRCRISDDVFKAVDTYIGNSPNNLNTVPRRRITI